MEIEAVAPPEGAVCSAHPMRVAAVTCSRCGDFCCEECIRVAGGEATCRPCAARPGVSRQIANPIPHLWNLVAKPDQFFASGVRFSGWVTLGAAYLVGVGQAFSQYDKRLWRRELLEATGTVAAGGVTYVPWSTVLFIALLGGIPWALFCYYVGGLWYGLRLRWSGVRIADTRGVRELNTYSDLPVDIPYLLMMVAAGFLFPTFDQRWGFPVEVLLFAVLGLVVIRASFVGARVRYGLRGRWGTFWFLGLPALRWLVGVAAYWWIESDSFAAWIAQQVA